MAQLSQALDPVTGDLYPATTADRTLALVCPYCHQSIILKRGPIREPHYAHKNAVCTVQTELHRRAIELLVTRPAQAIRLACGQWFPFTEPHRDSVIGRRRPDVLLKGADNTQLAIEIAVTHFIDTAKQADLRSLGCPALEITLGPEHALLSDDALFDLLIKETRNKEDFGLLPATAPIQAFPDAPAFLPSIDWKAVIGVIILIFIFFYTIYLIFIKPQRRSFYGKMRYLYYR